MRRFPRFPGVSTAVVALFLAAAAGPAAGEGSSWILPSSAFRAGAGGAEYRTDVRILNQGTVAATVTASFRDQASGETLWSNPVTVAPRSQAAYDNILASLFGRVLAQGAYGPIRFDSTSAIVVSSSVNNVNACGAGGIAGQWLPGIDASLGLRAGTIGQLAVSASAASGYRTNLVLVNPGTLAATATVRVRQGDGALLSSGTIGPLPANGFSQTALDLWSVFPGVGGRTDTDLWVEFTADHPLIAYATVIHNVSGDPFAVIATLDSAAAGPETTFSLPGGVPMTLVKVPAGTFLMGSPEAERNRFSDETLHPVTLTKEVWMGKTEVTQGQWRAVTGTSMPSDCGNFGVGDAYPVSCVTWTEVAGPGGFLDRLTTHLTATGQATSARLRLPTEAEWERAARAGTDTRFSFGDALDCDDACGSCTAASAYVWWCGNSSGAAHEAGTKGGNAWGLADVHGNVWEWVQDWYGPYPSEPVTDPSGPASGTAKVYRGGAWYNTLRYCRSASRYSVTPATRAYYIGFRVAR